MQLIASVSELHVSKGQKVVHLDLTNDEPQVDEIKKLILGPTGNLRAPTLRTGKTMVIGFNLEMYEQVFGA